jgi:dihydroxyacetone kinase-like predicted kinase
MNPSTAQILEVVESVPSPEVVLLPNNENIQPVAMQVVELATKPVTVVPTSGIVEGFAALLEYDPESDAHDNAVNMAASARRIVSGEVTRSVRSTDGPTGPIEKGDWLGLSREGIEVVGTSLDEVCCGLLEKLIEPRHELVTLIEGEGARHHDTRRITEWLDQNHEAVAVEVHHGGQPLYPYLISIE